MVWRFLEKKHERRSHSRTRVTRGDPAAVWSVRDPGYTFLLYLIPDQQILFYTLFLQVIKNHSLSSKFVLNTRVISLVSEPCSYE